MKKRFILVHEGTLCDSEELPPPPSKQYIHSPESHSRLIAQAAFPSSSVTISVQLYKNDSSSEVPVYLHSVSSVPSLLPKKLSNCSCFAGVVGTSEVPASSFFL